MVQIETSPSEVALARSRVYKALAAMMNAPTESLADGLRSGVVICGVSEDLALLADGDESYERVASALEDLREAIEAATEPPSLEQMRDEHMRVFTRGSHKCPPYETEYGYGNIFQKTNAMADVAGFYRAFGVDLAPDSHERVDCITTELEFMHLLTAKEAEAIETDNATGRKTCRSAQEKFLSEHLGRWARGFSQVLEEQTGPGLYPAAALAARLVSCEAGSFGLTPDPADFLVRCDEKEIEAKTPCMAEEQAACMAEGRRMS